MTTCHAAAELHVRRTLLKPIFIVLAGLAVAPIVPALAFALFSPAFNSDLGSIAGASVFFYLFALVPTIVLGVPAFVILLRFNLVRWWSSAVAGSLVGVVVAVVISGGASVTASALGFCAAVGALAALVFWLIARRAAVYRHDQVPAA